MPLKANEIKLTGKTSPVVVDFELKEGDTLEFTVVDTKDNKKVAETTFTYEVAKAEKAVVSSIELKTTDNKTSAPSGEKIEFEATAFDQFKSPKADASLRWVVNGKEVTNAVGTVAGNKLTLTTTTPGEYKVQVFSTDNTKVKAEKTVTIGAADLKTLELKPEVTLKDEDVKVTDADKRFNKEELVIGTLTPNEGAALVASNVKFHVTTSDKNLTKDDIKVTATEAETKDGKKVIVVKATTTKAGSFQVTPFVGEEFTADKTVKASVSTTIATKVNAEIATIEDIKFDAKDLKAGTPVKKAIEFKNKHGEVLTAAQVQETVNVTSSNDTVLDNPTETSIVQGSKDVEGEDVNKTYITFTSKENAKGTTVLTIQAGAVVKTHTLNFVGATLTKIDAGSKVTGVVAGDDDSKAKYNEINFLDQDGKKMAPQTATVEVTNAKGEALPKDASLVKLGTATKDDKGEIKFNDNQPTTHAQILATDKVAQGTYNVTVTSKVKDTNGKDVEVKGSFQVVVDAARAAKTVEVTAKAPTVTVAGTTTLTIVPKDQYGEFIAVTPEVKGDEFVTGGKVTAIDKEGKVTAIDKDIVAYQVTVTGAKKGTGTVKVDVKDTKGAVLATGSQSIKVDSVGNVIESVEIEEVKEVQSTNKAEATVELKATGKDAAGNDVAIAKDDLTWSIKSVKDADGKEVKLNAQGQVLDKEGQVVADQTVTINEDGKLTVSKGLTVEVEAEVTSANQKKATTVVKFEGADAVYTKDLAVATVKLGTTGQEIKAKDLEDKGLKLTFSKDSIVTADNTAKITVTFTGVNQYGETYEFKGADELTVATEDRSVAKAEAGAKGAVTLTVADMVQEGDKTFINVTAGKDTVKLEVTVSKEVADLVAAKQALAKAEKAVTDATTAKTTAEGAVKTAQDALTKAEDAVQPTEAQAKAIKDAEQAVAEAEQKVTAVKTSITPEGNLGKAVTEAAAALKTAEEKAVTEDYTQEAKDKDIKEAKAELEAAETAVTEAAASIAEGGELAKKVADAQAALDEAKAAVKPTEAQAKAIKEAAAKLEAAEVAKTKAEADLKAAEAAKIKAEADLKAAGGTIS